MAFVLPASLTITNVAACRGDLIGAIRANGVLELDASGVREVDIGGLQLLEATYRSARVCGASMRFAPSGRGAIEQVAAAAGWGLSSDISRWRDEETQR